MIVHVITGLAQGGAEAALFRLLAASGDPEKFHVISLSDEGVYGSRLRVLGVAVTCLRMRPGQASPLAFVRLIRLLRELHPEVVQTWMYHADLIAGIGARAAGIPVCWGIRHSNLSPEANKRGTLRIAKLCAWLSGRIPSRIVSCSHRAAALHQAFGYAPKFVIVPNGLDLSAFFPDARVGAKKRADLSILQSERVIGHVGRFDAQKDYPTLLSACAKLRELRPGFRFLLCGKDLEPNNPALNTLIKKYMLDDTVIMLGPRNDIAELMRSMDIFVLSSLGEAFPNVVTEAMASGVPCVVTDVGDAAEIVGDTGWVVPPRDPQALALAMAEALSETPEQRAVRGQAARKRIEEKYDIARMVTAYRQVWNDVVAQGGRACAD